MASWAEIRAGNRRQQKLREIARKTAKNKKKPYVKITMHKVPLEHPKSKARAKPAKSIAHPVSTRASTDRRVGRVSAEYVKPKAKSLAHPVSTRNRDDRQVGRVSDEHTGFNLGSPTPVTPSAARAALGFNTGYPTGVAKSTAYRSPAAKAVGLVTKSSGNNVPLAKTTPPTIGSRIKNALKGGRQQNQIKALQRQHRAARKGTSAEVRTQVHR